GDVRVRDVRAKAHGDGDDGLARGDAWQPGGITSRDEQRHGDERGIAEWRRQRRASRLFEREHEVDRAAAEPAMRLGDEKAEHAELGQSRPGEVVARTNRRRRTGAPQRFAHAVPKGELLVAKREMHRHLRGRPSTRSAMTLRWISLVPA